MCLVSASCCKGEGCNGQPKYLQTNRLTDQWRDVIRSFLRVVFFAKVWHFTGLLISLIFLGCGAVLYVHFVRRRKTRLWMILFRSGLCASCRLCERRCLWTGFTITTTVNRSGQILTRVGLLFSELLTVYSVIGISVGELINPHDIEGQR